MKVWQYANPLVPHDFPEGISLIARNHAGINLIVHVVLQFLLLLSAAHAGEKAGGQKPFELVKGQDVDVCRAYLDRLNRTEFQTIPFCGRPENAQVDGFATLNRVPLTPEQLHQVYEHLIGFAEQGDQHYFDNYRTRQLAFCEKPAYEKLCAQIKEQKSKAEAQGYRWGEPLSLSTLRLGQTQAWRYNAEVDIDNDGRPDPILLYRERRCGGESSKGGPELAATFAFIMDEKYQVVDERRTREIFGHPNPHWPLVDNKRFRYIGSQMGVFSYRGHYYFDTFFISWSDFNDARVNDEDLLQTLGVFRRTSGKTEQICEYHWRDLGRELNAIGKE